jgi:hypothetical protein
MPSTKDITHETLMVLESSSSSKVDACTTYLNFIKFVLVQVKQVY